MEFVVDVVALQPLEKVQQRVAEYRPRTSFGICGILRDAVFDVVADTLEQRVKQVFLIFEMPSAPRVTPAVWAISLSEVRAIPLR